MSRPGQRPHEAHHERAAHGSPRGGATPARRGTRRSCGGPWRVARTVATRSSDSSSRKCAPSTMASRRSSAIAPCSASERRCAGRRTQSTSSSAPSRLAEREARRSSRCERAWGVTSARMRSASGGGRRVLEHGRLPALLDVLGHLAQRQLAQRGEVLEAEEVRQAPPPRGAARVDLAGPDARLQLARARGRRGRPRRPRRGCGRGRSRARARR